MKIGRWELRRHLGWAKPYRIRNKRVLRIYDFVVGIGPFQLSRRVKKEK